MSPRPKIRTAPLIGWREWVALPDFGIAAIKAKVDTGARTSSLHAFELVRFAEAGAPWVRFIVHPRQRLLLPAVELQAPVVDERPVRSSSGHAARRPVIRTAVQLLGATFDIELTLADRDEMGFRMLLGREALRGRFLVDPTRSYYNGRRAAAPDATRKGVPAP